MCLLFITVSLKINKPKVTIKESTDIFDHTEI